jgi:hypothetical protein
MATDNEASRRALLRSAIHMGARMFAEADGGVTARTADPDVGQTLLDAGFTATDATTEETGERHYRGPYVVRAPAEPKPTGYEVTEPAGEAATKSSYPDDENTTTKFVPPAPDAPITAKTRKSKPSV